MTDDDNTNNSPPAKAPHTRWYKGMPQSPNPRGRGKGNRSRISQALVEDFSRHWRENGYSAIERVFADNPGLYLKIATSLVPRELLLQIARPLENMSDSELQLAAEQEHQQAIKMLEHVKMKVGAEIVETAAREVLGEDEENDETKDGD